MHDDDTCFICLQLNYMCNNSRETYHECRMDIIFITLLVSQSTDLLLLMYLKWFQLIIQLITCNALSQFLVLCS